MNCCEKWADFLKQQSELWINHKQEEKCFVIYHSARFWDDLNSYFFETLKNDFLIGATTIYNNKLAPIAF
jgi:hypothetical protein